MYNKSWIFVNNIYKWLNLQVNMRISDFNVFYRKE